MDQARFQNAISLRDSGRCGDAIRELSSLEAEVSSPEEKGALLINQHRCFCELNQLTEAARVMVRIHELALTDERFCLVADFGEACMHVQMGEIKKGLREFNKILIMYQSLLQDTERDLYENIQIRRATALASLGRNSESIDILTEASTFTKISVEDKQEVYYYLGLCHEQLGENALAKQDYLNTIALNIDNEVNLRARYQLALLYFNACAFAQAKRQLEIFLQTCNRDIPNLPITYIYEQLSHVCKHLGEKVNAEKYSKLAGERKGDKSR